MAILSASLLISALSLFHITVAYYLYSAPLSVARHGFTLILSSAFSLRISPSFSEPSTALTLISCLLAFVGLSDLTAAQLPAEVGAFYWGAQAPLRAAFFFGLTGWGWLAGPKGLQSMGDAGGASATLARGNFSYGPVSDGLIFSWAFGEMMMWFWIFITLRDERRELAAKAQEQLERSRQQF